MSSRNKATVVRDFSVNKETSNDNLSEKSLMVLWLIIDGVNKVDDIPLFPFTNELLSHASSVRKKYYKYRTKEKTSLSEGKCSRLAEDIHKFEAVADSKDLEAGKQDSIQMLMQEKCFASECRWQKGRDEETFLVEWPFQKHLLVGW